MKLLASVASILLCILFATSFLLGQSPMRVADAASRTIGWAGTRNARSSSAANRRPSRSRSSPTSWPAWPAGSATLT